MRLRPPNPTSGVVSSPHSPPTSWWGLSPLFWKQLGDVDGHRHGRLAHPVHRSRRRAHSSPSTGRHGELRPPWPPIAPPSPRPPCTGALLGRELGRLCVGRVGDERVVEASLGYFMNPLVSVFLGVVVPPRVGSAVRSGRRWRSRALGVAWLTFTVGIAAVGSLALAGADVRALRPRPQGRSPPAPQSGSPWRPGCRSSRQGYCCSSDAVGARGRPRAPARPRCCCSPPRVSSPRSRSSCSPAPHDGSR